MSKIFGISDTHFCHKNSLNWRTEFKSIDEMDSLMIKNWNKTVSPEDTVYHLGDEFLGNSLKAKEILKSLNGYKILIRGNHSTKSDAWYKNAGFSEIHKMVYLISPTRPGKIRYIFTHYPIPYAEIEALESMGNYKIISVHGHVHNSTDRTFTGDDIWEHPESYLNLCVEKTNYTPVELSL